jgi:hypothetical protein
MASSLAEHRWNQRERDRVAAAALLLDARTPASHHAELVMHMEAAAAQAGYQLSTVRVGPTPKPRALARELRAKGITAVIVGRAPSLKNFPWIDFPLDEFVWIALHEALHLHAFHRVICNVFREMLDAIEQIRALGYRRIAFIASPESAARTAMRQHATLLFLRDLDPSLTLLHVNADQLKDPRQCERLRCETEVLLLAYPRAKEFAASSVLDDFPQASLALRSWNCPDLAGMFIPEQRVAAATIDLLDGQFRRGDRGIPSHRHTIMVENTWRAGTSLPPLTKDNGQLHRTIIQDRQ